MDDDESGSIEGTIQLDGIISPLVLKRVWQGGYGGFDFISSTDVQNGIFNHPYDEPQLSFDPKLDALVVMAGRYIVYDDNGYYDGGWDVLPEAKRLAINRKTLVDLIANEKFGEVKIPSEYTSHTGKRTFDFSPRSEQYAALEKMEDPDETVIPKSFGDTTPVFSYGTVLLSIAKHEDGKIGIIIHDYVPTTNLTSQRDANFFADSRNIVAYPGDLDQRIIGFLEKEKKYAETDYIALFPFLAVRKSLGLSLSEVLSRLEYSAYGNTGHYEGSLAYSKICHKCSSRSMFSGTFSREHEKVMYAELGGTDDESNYYHTTHKLKICLDCENSTEEETGSTW